MDLLNFVLHVSNVFVKIDIAQVDNLPMVVVGYALVCKVCLEAFLVAKIRC